MESSSACPICNLIIPVFELERHANNHFSDEDYAADFEFAQQIAQIAEDSSDCGPSFWDNPQSSSSQCNAKTTSCVGRNYDENYVSLVQLQRKGTFYKVEGNLMTLLRNCLELDSKNSVSILSGHVDHFQSIESEDVGWGCGWRNIQMLSSHLLSQRHEAREALYGGSGFVPDIASLQRWLELAWEKGFDTPGSHDFDRRIYGKKNWIGTTECAALLRYFGLRAKVVDFCSKDFELASSSFKVGKGDTKVDKGPMDIFLSKGKIPSENKSFKTSSEKGHHVLTEWVWNYFSDNNVNRSGNHRVILSEKAPLYFQHDGHSRTIVGIQATRESNGQQLYNLLIFDPAIKTKSLEESLRKNIGWQKLIKRGIHTLKKPLYQLCYVDPGIACGKELENLKTIDSIRHEF
ncbi:hypothetical protein ACJIZ3_003436 [Penstemon smallii]|uniref:UFSP1/2/DUB catalytic domain-containing protein n=1 Tax=Penstemon smallii TaxID=265156 RepID=A0ABD3UD13_9LAMI